MRRKRSRGGVIRPDDYVVEAQTDCWIWKGQMRNASPVLSSPGRTSRSINARRELFMVERQLITHADLLEQTCGQTRCVNPHHATIVRREEAARRRARDRSSLSWEDVQTIRREAAWVLRRDHAERYGIDASLVTLIVQNEHWFDPDYTPLLKQCAIPECAETFPASASRICCCNAHNRLHNNRKRRQFYERHRKRKAAATTRGTRPRAQALDDSYEVRPSGCWVWTGKLSDGRWPYMPYAGPLSGSRAPRKELWLRAGRTLEDGWRVHPSCGEALCVNPAHARSVPPHRPPHKLSQDVASAIRSEPVTAKHAVLAERFAVHPTTIGDVVDNQTWRDHDYVPDNVRICTRPGCLRRFRSNRSNRRYCTTKCGELHRRRLASGYYERQAIDRSGRRSNQLARATLGCPASLDAAVGQDGTATLGQFVADTAAEDPFESAATNASRALLRGLSEDDVERMDERELARLRARLAAAGFKPSVQRGADC